MKLGELLSRLKDPTPVMDSFGKHMMPSIRKNFDVGGRPTWDKLANVVVIPKGQKRRKGQRRQGEVRMGGPLVLTGDLRNSIGYTPSATDLVLWAKPNPNVKGPVHQFGTTKAGKNHNVTIPARPYLVFQKADIDWFRKALAGWIRVGGLA